ncbi:nucleotide-binding oligomerization domain-containing protein 1-like [Amblyraja radiata]|uniref:nucleotide-binding oligomerization domain-containing protein 1-like n=1 Tax=Amblyraja radiata TaxID=386614 RepID=UPI001403C43C|nr:nucleotide-binding oligomerization domain-containing protein 1-like [Amblyraja radiata]
MEQGAALTNQASSYLDLLTVRRVELVNGIKNTDCILDNLLHTGYFTSEDMEFVQQSVTRHEKVRKILDITMAKGEDCAEYVVFILYSAKGIYSDVQPWLKEIDYSPPEHMLREPVLITDAVCQYIEKLRSAVQQDTRFTSSYTQKEDVLFDDIYTESIMEVINAVNETKGTITHLQDLFSDTGIINKDVETVFVTGDAGVGKTILLQRLQNLWAKGELCADIKFFFKFKCRMFNSFEKENKISLRDLLFKYNCYPDKDADEIFSYIRQYPATVLFTLDGFDEMNVDLNDIPDISSPFEPTHPVALVLNLLRGKLLKGSIKLLTARTGTDLPLRMVRKRIVLKGFSKEHWLGYLKKSFKNKGDQTIILTQLEANPHLCSLCSVPLLCWIIFKCYEHLLFASSSQSLSNSITLTDIYLVMVEVFLNHNSQDNLHRSNDRSQLNVFRRRKEALMRIGKLALKGTENNDLVLNQEKIEAANICEEDFQLGFIKTTGQYNGRGNQTTYEYIHVTIQCFFAAFSLLLDDEISPQGFLASFNDGNAPRSSSRTINKFFSLKRESSTNVIKSSRESLQFTLFFLCGLLSDSNISLMQSLASPSAIKKKQAVLKSYLFSSMKTHLKGLPRLKLKDGCNRVHVLPRFIWLIRYIFEKQNRAAAKVAAKYISADYIKLNFCNVSSADCSALAFILRHILKPLALELDNNNINDYGVEQLTSCFWQLTVLRLSVNQITDHGVRILVEELKKYQKIRILGLYQNYISDVGARDVANLVEVCPSLINLRIGKNMITHKGGTYLAKAIRKSKTIQELGFWGNQIGDKGAEEVAEALIDHHSLKEMSLAANLISSKGGQHLAKALCKNNSLKILWLTQNDLDDEAAECFGEMLRVNCSLEKLWLNENKITSKGTAHLLQALKGNTTIDEICLTDNQILPDDIQHFVKDKRIII